MKNKSGFVSNSSSTSFIIGIEGVNIHTVEILKGVLKFEPYYLDMVTEDPNYLCLELDNNVDVNTLLDLEFLENLGCIMDIEC